MHNCCCYTRSLFSLIVKCKLNRDTVIIVCVLILYSSNRFIFKIVVNVPIISYLLKCYFNDWLGGIFIVAYINVILQHSRYKHMRIHTLSCAILINTFFGIVWEFFGPYVCHYGTSDYYDILAYIVGGITYIMLQRILVKREQAP